MNRDAVARLAHGCALEEILDSGLASRLGAVEAFEARIKTLEQYHCEHEFSKREKGCLESIFCSKCGVLHPDWERDRDCDSSPGRVYVFKTPANMVVIDGRVYRKKKEEDG